MQVRLTWEEFKVAATWVLSSGFAAVIAFLAIVRPATDAAWDASFGRNKEKAEARIREMFADDFERWDQAAVNAGAALQVNATLEHMAIELEKQGNRLARMSGYLESMTGGSWTPPAS